MMTMRTMQHIASSKTIASFRSIPSLIAPQARAIDRGRQAQGIGQRVAKEQYRQHKNPRRSVSQ